MGRKPPPSWLFGITNIPFGIAGGYTSVAMPFILHQAGVSMATIAAVSAAALVPLSYQFLWAPVLDIGLRRRSWLILTATLSGLLLGASLCLKLPSQLFLFEVLCVAGQALSGLVSSSNGALVASLIPPGAHGRASGWLNAANLGGNALGGGLVLGTLRWLGPHSAAAVIAVLSFLPALAILPLHEPPRPGRRATLLFSTLWREVWGTARSRRGWTGILFCLAPVSTPALLDLFSAVADDYRAAPATVEWTMGYGSGLLTALGALLGGLVLDRVDRRTAYLVSGVMIAVVDLLMRAAPLTEETYIAGTLAYSLVAGLCFAAFSAMILEIIGTAGNSAAAQYTLFDAAGNLATSYLAWFDGVGYDWSKARHGVGAPGLLLTDAGMNLLGVVGLCLMMWMVSRRSGLTRQAGVAR